MGLVKGLAVASFQIVNYTKSRPCCSLNVLSQLDKCYLGNMTGMTFSSDILPHPDVKALLILSRFQSPISVFQQKLIQAQRSTHCSSPTPSFINKQPAMCLHLLSCVHTLLQTTHGLSLVYPALHCSIE